MMRKYNIDNKDSNKSNGLKTERLFSVIICPKPSSIPIRKQLYSYPGLLIILKPNYYE